MWLACAFLYPAGLQAPPHPPFPLFSTFFCRRTRMNPFIRRTTTTTALAALLLAGGAAWAKDNVAHVDASFMKNAAEAGLAEVEASKLAVTKATNTQVKGFAQQMVDDHTKANDELKALAATKGVELPAEPSMAQRAKLKALQGADGANFDKRYAETFGLKAHEDTVNLFQKQSKKAKDPEVKAWAEKTLPKLQHHLEMAKDLNNAVKGEKAAAKADKKS
jgi:putative membrane protein